MIELVDITKRFRSRTSTLTVLDGITLRIARDAKLALIGRNGAGKSTLLNIIGGMEPPTSGRIVRGCRVSWPLGLSGGFQGSLTGVQNARFVARIHGLPDTALAEQIAFVRAFSELGPALERPVKTYSSGMRARFAFAVSLMFDFDTYLVDELTAVGDGAFRRKSKDAFRALAARAGLVMVSHDEATLKAFCDSAVWLHEGRAHCFDSVDEALVHYKAACG